MPIAYCHFCGNKTNSSVSNYILDIEQDGVTKKECGIVTCCYASIIDGKWVVGCGYHHATPIVRKLVDSLISDKGV